MPQISQYDAPNIPLQVPERGAEALAQGARRLGTLGNEAATPLRHGLNELAGGVESIGKQLEFNQAQGDKLQAHKDLADFTAGSLKTINDIEANIDPNNIQASLNQVNESIDHARDAYMDKYQSHAGRQYAENLWDSRADLIRNHIIAVGANAAGDAAHKNLTGTLNTYIGTANTNGDMSTFDHMLGTGNQAIKTAAEMVPGDKRQQFITDQTAAYGKQLAISTLEGMLPTQPRAAQAILDSGRLDQYLGPQKEHFYKAVETADRILQVQGRQDQVAMDKANKEDFQDAAKGLVLSTIKPDGTGMTVPPDFAQSLIKLGQQPGASFHDIENLAKLSHSITQQNSKGVPDTTDPSVYATLSTKIMSNPTQQGLSDQIYQAKFDHKLADKDFTFLYTALNRGEKQDFTQHLDTKAIDQTLSTVQGRFGMGPGAQATPSYARFMTWFNQGLADAHTKGKTTGDFLNSVIDQPPEFFNRFKNSIVPNAGSGLGVTGPLPEGGAYAPIPPAGGQQSPLGESIVHKAWQSLWGEK